jgi:hypothetical protein
MIGVPIFIKVFHPELTLKDYQILREKEHFLMQKTTVCDECFLIVSKKYQGGYPYPFSLPNHRPQTAQIPIKKYLQDSAIEFQSQTYKPNKTPLDFTEGLEDSALLPPKIMNLKTRNLEIDDFFPEQKATASTATASKSHSKGFFKPGSPNSAFTSPFASPTAELRPAS